MLKNSAFSKRHGQLPLKRWRPLVNGIEQEQTIVQPAEDTTPVASATNISDF
jgi:hypothetical protein